MPAGRSLDSVPNIRHWSITAKRLVISAHLVHACVLQRNFFVKMDNSSKCKLLLIERFFWIGRLIISFVSCILSQTGAKILYNFARQKTERVQIRYNQRLQILKAPIAFPQITASIWNMTVRPVQIMMNAVLIQSRWKWNALTLVATVTSVQVRAL